ncbi:5'-methylthioadenosine/adenosylhomocysteine nucleosidase [uncultured Anaerovibrio sp.]|uniref:5'-methylthioadenosine/adenosylhomocysteine nucleosidase n=1 Tax=uncultured Anaerovibrio sp. TaxID=361586 RepID=UPI0026038841|nr:5'-methylthioadenosine/adenosylhomocysteine nucleosidase [uncultured Anaerovibrio sp.]
MVKKGILVLFTVLSMLCCLSQFDPVISEAHSPNEDYKIKIGIIGAMKSEVDSLKENMEISRRETKASMEFCEGHIGKMNVVVVQSGMGKVHAGICAQILADDFQVTHIINTGVAGALRNELDIGDIVISKDAVQHDFTVEVIGFKKGEIPFTGLVAFKADDTLRQNALEAIRVALPNIRAVDGRVCSGDQFISSQDAKDRIIEDFDGTCVEMEGAAIAQVCYENHIPFVILRAISDKADGSAQVSFADFEQKAAKNSSRLVHYMLENW